MKICKILFFTVSIFFLGFAFLISCFSGDENDEDTGMEDEDDDFDDDDDNDTSDDDDNDDNDENEVVIDDFSSCDPDLASKLGTQWYTFDDMESGGTSTSVIELVQEGYGESECSLHWYGEVTDAASWAFAGMGVSILPVAFEMYGQMILVVRGDGREYRAEFPMLYQDESCQEVNMYDCDYYGFTFFCGNGSSTWKEVSIPFDSLEQEGWGDHWGWDPDDVADFQVHTLGQPIEEYQCKIGLVKLLL